MILSKQYNTCPMMKDPIVPAINDITSSTLCFSKMIRRSLFRYFAMLLIYENLGCIHEKLTNLFNISK